MARYGRRYNPSVITGGMGEATGYVLPVAFRSIGPNRGPYGPVDVSITPPYIGEKLFEADWSEVTGPFQELAGNDPDRIMTRLSFTPTVSAYDVGEGAYNPNTIRVWSMTRPLYMIKGYEKIGPGQYRLIPSSDSALERMFQNPFVVLGLPLLAFGAAIALAPAGGSAAVETAVSSVAVAPEAGGELIAAQFAQNLIPATIAAETPAAAVAALTVPSSTMLFGSAGTALAKGVAGMAVSKVISSVVGAPAAQMQASAQAQANLAAQLQAAQAQQETSPGLLLAGALLLIKLLA